MKKEINFRLINILIVILILVVAGISIGQQKDDKGKLIGNELLNTKCGKCHGVDRPLGKNKSMEEWQATVMRMQGKDPGWISDNDVKEIVWFLTSKSVFETKCSKCHGTDRPLGKTKDKAGWQETVKRMQSKNPDWINNSEAEQIIDYLLTVKGG